MGLDKKITESYSKADFERLVDLLTQCSFDKLRMMIDDHLTRKIFAEEPAMILSAIFKGCSVDQTNLSCHALAAFTHCLKLISSADISQKLCAEVLSVLLLEADQLSTGGLVDSSKLLIDMIRTGEAGSGRVLEVFPKILVLIEQKPEVHTGSGQGAMHGSEYKKHILNNLCCSKWSSESITQLVKVFKDVSMSCDEVEFFLSKILKQLSSMKIQEVAPLIQHMLPMAGSDCHEHLLRGIFTTFHKFYRDESGGSDSKANVWSQLFCEDSEAVEDNLPSDVQSAAGEVLGHLFNMSRWDQTLGKSLIKILKVAKEAVSVNSISTLCIGFALSLTQMKTLKEHIIDLLKSIVFRSFSHHHKEYHSNWLKQRSVVVPDVKNMFLAIVKSCRHGWQQAIPGIVDFGFCLMDSYTPKGGAFGRTLEGEPLKEDSPQQACRDLGGYLIACMFKEQKTTRADIIEEILNRVITKTTSPIHHYIDVLRGVGKRYPETLLDCKDKLKEFLEHICLISPANADCMLQALLPLIKINAGLKDSLILVLRKALFSGQLNGRIIACNGFMLLLQSFRVKGYVSLSQASSQSTISIFSLASQNLGGDHSSVADESSHDDSNNQTICLEILSSMRRCLTQQAQVRSLLYQGLWNIIGRNAHLAGPIIEKLLQHFRLYYEDHEGILPPLKVASCIKIVGEGPVLMEPLPLLLSALFLCLRKGQDCQKRGGFDEDDLIDEHLILFVHEIFQSLSSRLAKSEMEDFELDKTADFSLNTSVGTKNNLTAGLVLGCYHVLMEYNFLQDRISEDTANKMLRLHALYKKVREALTAGKKDGSKALTSSVCASPVFVKSLICRLLDDDSPDNEVGLSLLREDGDFMKYAFDLVQQTIATARDHGTIKSIGGQDKVCIREMCISVGHACLKKFMQTRSTPSNFGVSQYCLEVYRSSLQYIITRKNKRLEEFLTSTFEDSVENTSDKTNVQEKHIRRFQRIIISYLSEDADLSASQKKILPLLVCIIELLTFATCDNESQVSNTPFSCGIAQVNEWVGKLCKERVIDDNAVTKSLISLHLRLSNACGPWTGTDRAAQGSEGATRDMAKDIHVVAGDIDADDPLIVSHIDSSLEETDWLLQRLKGQVALLLAEEKLNKNQSGDEAGDESDFHKRRRKIESAMCTRLGNLLIAYREFVLSPLPLGPPIESVFRGLTKLFTLLAGFTKYYTWIVTQGVSKSLLPRFEKLIRLMGTEVTRHVYPFITHFENLQTSRTNQAKKRRRKEDKENATNAEKQKVLRETKSIPPMIYAIENLERFLMTLGKKCKVNLLSGHKLPTSRDFRIKSALVKEALTRKDDDDSIQETQVVDKGVKPIREITQTLGQCNVSFITICSHSDATNDRPTIATYTVSPIGFTVEMTSDLRRPQTPASVVLAKAINAVLHSFAKHSSDGMVIASEALQEFWDMKCTHEQSSPTISYEIETEIVNGQRCFVSYVTLPGGSCFGSSGWCKDEKSANENAAKVALMNSVFNEHPSRQINSALINRILSNVASKSSDSNQKVFRSCLDAFKSMLLASDGKSVLMFQEMMTIFQLLHWNGNLKEMKRRKCSREEVIARYAGTSMDQKMRDSMVRNWKSKEMKLPGVVQTELVEAEEAMRHSREIGVDLRFHKEKRRILRLVLSELSILSPVLKSEKLQGPSPVIMDVVEDDINVTI